MYFSYTNCSSYIINFLLLEDIRSSLFLKVNIESNEMKCVIRRVLLRILATKVILFDERLVDYAPELSQPKSSFAMEPRMTKMSLFYGRSFFYNFDRYSSLFSIFKKSVIHVTHARVQSVLFTQYLTSRSNICSLSQTLYFVITINNQWHLLEKYFLIVIYFLLRW